MTGSTQGTFVQTLHQSVLIVIKEMAVNVAGGPYVLIAHPTLYVYRVTAFSNQQGGGCLSKLMQVQRGDQRPL